MNINYPTKISWQLKLDHITNVNDIYNNRTKKDILNSLDKFEASPYYFVFEDVDEHYMDTFFPLYKENIESIHSGVVRDIKTLVLVTKPIKGSYQSISLYHGDVLLGGIIFVTYKSVIYEISKVFPKTVDFAMKVNLTFLAEYKLFEFAIDKKIRKINFGVDKNLYGTYGNIGLAIYKLRTGALPFVAKANAVEIHHEYIFNQDTDADTLVFLGGTKGEPITQGILFLNSQTKNLDKYSALLKNTDIQIQINQ